MALVPVAADAALPVEPCTDVWADAAVGVEVDAVADGEDEADAVVSTAVWVAGVATGLCGTCRTGAMAMVGSDATLSMMRMSFRRFPRIMRQRA